MAKIGYPVVGIDTLRYYWQHKTPEQSAKDLTELMQRFGLRTVDYLDSVGWLGPRTWLAPAIDSITVLPVNWSSSSTRSLRASAADPAPWHRVYAASPRAEATTAWSVFPLPGCSR